MDRKSVKISRAALARLRKLARNANMSMTMAVIAALQSRRGAALDAARVGGKRTTIKVPLFVYDALASAAQSANVSIADVVDAVVLSCPALPRAAPDGCIARLRSNDDD